MSNRLTKDIACLFDIAKKREVVCGQTLKFAPGTLRANIKNENTVTLNSIRYPTEQEPKGMLVCNVSTDGSPRWEEYYPEVFGLDFISYDEKVILESGGYIRGAPK